MVSESTNVIDEPTVTPLPSASDVMSSQIQTCSSFSTVIEAVLIIKDEGRGIVPVIEEGKPKGVVTSRDITLAVSNRGDLSAQPVSEIMTTDVTQLAPETPLDEIVRAFQVDGVRQALVVDGEGDYLGVITWTDLIPYMTYRNPRGVATSME